MFYAMTCIANSRPWACSVDLVLLGAEGVVENGGIINKLGTLNIALAAAAHNKPVYVAAESYKVSVCNAVDG